MIRVEKHMVAVEAAPESIWFVSSQTTPGAWYMVTFDEHVHCSCSWGRMEHLTDGQHRTGRPCGHIKFLFKDELDRIEEPSTIG